MNAGEVQQATEEVWRKMPFTNIVMYDKIVEWTEHGWAKFVSLTPEQCTSQYGGTLKHIIQWVPPEVLGELCLSCTGLCTAYSIHVCATLCQNNSFSGLEMSDLDKTTGSDFFFDTGSHRLAVTRTGLVVDSTIREVLQLQNGEAKGANGVTVTAKSIGKDDGPVVDYKVHPSSCRRIVYQISR